MFNAYHKWLGLPEEQQLPTYYQLLGIDPEETNLKVIRESGIRQISYLRNYQTGPRAAECVHLLNEIAQTQATLLNPARRSEYDAGLRFAEVGCRAAPVCVLDLPAPADMYVRAPGSAMIPPAGAASCQDPIPVFELEPAFEYQLDGTSTVCPPSIFKPFTAGMAATVYVAILLFAGWVSFWMSL